MKLKQAAAYSAMGEKRLKRLAEECEIRGVSDPDINRGDWFFDRLSIDKYREGQALHYKIIELKLRDLEKRLGF